ncbi:hypothetical protein BJY01DRAFT_246027 [Aspergillus pseudoustus]|uniref:Uncharacterized protein n=1 Tax=Aspergillus pseudoustus TaxID=1810923 RepID=A0ABR4KAF6_9EURO
MTTTTPKTQETKALWTQTLTLFNTLQSTIPTCPPLLLSDYAPESIQNHRWRWLRLQRDIQAVAGLFTAHAQPKAAAAAVQFLHALIEDVARYLVQCLARIARHAGKKGSGSSRAAWVSREDVLFVGDCGQAVQAALVGLETVVGVYRDRDERGERIRLALRIEP